MSDALFIRRLFIAAAVVALFVVTWWLSGVALLLFAAVLLAFTLTQMGAPLRWLGLPNALAVAMAALATIALIVAGATFFGREIGAQAQALVANFREAVTQLAQQLAASPLGAWVDSMNPSQGLSSILGTVVSWSVSLGQALVGLALVLVGGFYMAVSQTSYRDGLLKLVPADYRANVSATLDDIATALHWWIKGQLTVMIVVGALTAAALTIAGVKSALALGALAGLANFVPYIGSIAAAAVTLVIASSQGVETLGYAAAAMFLVQQLESNVLTPIIVGRAVSIEPVVGLFALVAMGSLFGPLGLLLGFPLTIVADIAIRRLYVRDALDEGVEILGEPAQRSKDAAL